MKVPRISLNFDSDYGLKSLALAQRLKEKLPNAFILMRRSSSGRGWHFWVKNWSGTIGENLKIREELQDCRGRLRADKIRARAGLRIGILFEYKNGKYAGAWEPLSLKKIFLEDFKVIGLETAK